MKNKRIKLPKKNKKGAYETKLEEMVKCIIAPKRFWAKCLSALKSTLNKKFSVTSYLVMLSAFKLNQ